MSTETQLSAIQTAIENSGEIKKYTVDDTEVEHFDLDKLTQRELILMTRRNRATRGGISTRINFSNGIT